MVSEFRPKFNLYRTPLDIIRGRRYIPLSVSNMQWHGHAGCGGQGSINNSIPPVVFLDRLE